MHLAIFKADRLSFFARVNNTVNRARGGKQLAVVVQELCSFVQTGIASVKVSWRWSEGALELPALPVALACGNGDWIGEGICKCHG